MGQAGIAVESQHLAEELYRLIQTLDPARWRAEFEQSAHEMVTRVKERLGRALESGASAADAVTDANALGAWVATQRGATPVHDTDSIAALRL